MDTVETLTQRNAQFAAHRLTSSLKMMPSLKTIIIGCVDPRVDPAQILGIDLGEVVVIRNIGDPAAAVELDITALRAAPTLPSGLRISGLVYDVATGQIETVVAPSGFRQQQTPEH